MKFFDLHADTPYESYKKGLTFNSGELAVSLDCVRLFDKWRQIFAIWIDEKQQNPYRLYQEILRHTKKQLKYLPEKFSYILSVEGGSVLERDIGRIHKLYCDGIRILTLTWNGENAIAGGVNSNAGLSRFGKNVLREMNELKMVCDASHLNRKSFYKVIDTADNIIATHSNCFSIYEHKRNLTDEQIRLIAEKGGIIGINFFSGFLGGDTFEKTYENIYHLLEMGFEENISIGSDFDGAAMDTRLCSTYDIPMLYFKLSEKGIKDRVLDNIFYNNAENYFKRLDKYLTK